MIVGLWIFFLEIIRTKAILSRILIEFINFKRPLGSRAHLAIRVRALVG